MKKIIAVLCFIFVLASKASYVDVASFQSEKKTIEVKGEVVTPGVYEVDRHTEVAEILRLAGGTSQEADVSGINQTLDLPNHSVLVVPAKKEERLVSINTATQEELDSLPGIGPAIALRIMEYRSKTPFTKLEDIKEVKGIGDALYEKLREHICL